MFPNCCKEQKKFVLPYVKNLCNEIYRILSFSHSNTHLKHASTYNTSKVRKRVRIFAF